MKGDGMRGVKGGCFQSFSRSTDDGEDSGDGGEVEEGKELGFEDLRRGRERENRGQIGQRGSKEKEKLERTRRRKKVGEEKKRWNESLWRRGKRYVQLHRKDSGKGDLIYSRSVRDDLVGNRAEPVQKRERTSKTGSQSFRSLFTPRIKGLEVRKV